MAMRNDHKVELREINAKRVDVVFEDDGIVSCVKKDALAIVFDQGRESPVLGDLLGIRKSVVEDGDAILRGRRKRQNQSKE